MHCLVQRKSFMFVRGSVKIKSDHWHIAKEMNSVSFVKDRRVYLLQHWCSWHLRNRAIKTDIQTSSYHIPQPERQTRYRCSIDVYSVNKLGGILFGAMCNFYGRKNTTFHRRLRGRKRETCYVHILMLLLSIYSSENQYVLH